LVRPCRTAGSGWRSRPTEGRLHPGEGCRYPADPEPDPTCRYPRERREQLVPDRHAADHRCHQQRCCAPRVGWMDRNRCRSEIRPVDRWRFYVDRAGLDTTSRPGISSSPRW
jgi:hypothetical protein